MMLHILLKEWRKSVFPITFLLMFCLAFPVMAGGRLEYEYRQAELSFKRLFKDPKKQKDRHQWLSCVKKFKSVYTAQPSGPRADDALFMIGRLHLKLYKSFCNVRDREEAADYFDRLLKRFPESAYRRRAKEMLAELSTAATKSCAQRKSRTVPLPVKKSAKKRKLFPRIRKEHAGKQNLKVAASHLAIVRGLRFWSTPNYTRVVIDVDSEVPYKYRLLKKDPAISKPQRLYVDVDNARMGKSVKPFVPIGDDLLSDARAAQYTADTVRIVLDIKSIDRFKIFSLRNPFRIVLDIDGIPIKTPGEKRSNVVAKRQGSKLPEVALAKQLALGVRRIVIDPGHGGKDPGAIGYYRSVKEKNVTLEVSKRLARKIREKLGCETILTRDRDVFLSLEERTAIANTKGADIFVSIHANANRNKRCHGIETYFLNLATDNEAIMVAARENATSTKNISDLEAILNDLLKNAMVSESSRLAGHVQHALIQKLKPRYKRVQDKGVKQAPFYVLLGAQMPSILVEIAFLTNPTECRRLNSASYQERVADAIATGIQNYIREISPLAFRQTP